MTLALRWYQEEAKAAVWAALRTRTDNPCVVLPTGSGKTPLLASLCKEAVDQWNGKVVIVSHVKELLEQSATTLLKYYPAANIGIYSAGLKQKNHWAPIVVAGIQSIYEKGLDLGERHLVIVDEAHLIPPAGDGMYQRFIADLKQANPKLRVIGLTATPYRTTSGKICRKSGILNHVCYSASVGRLMKDGFLCPLVNKPGGVAVDTSKIAVRQGDFVQGELERAFDVDGLVKAACADLVSLASDRSSILVFSAGVSHGQHIADELGRLGLTAGFLCGDTPDLERASLIAAFKQGSLRCLVNVNVLTTGFDATRVDCVAVVRATCSPGLFYQMVGRGFRLDPSKSDCLILDYGGNLERHGSLDDPNYGESRGGGIGTGSQSFKICPACEEELATAMRQCPCGFLFPLPKPNHDPNADTTSPVIASIEPPVWHVVDKVEWGLHKKRGGDGPQSLRVDYFVDGGNMPISEWVCLEHTGYARDKAINWWLLRSKAPVPATVWDAVHWRMRLAVADTLKIEVQADPKNSKFKRILHYELGPVPEEDAWEAERETEDEFATTEADPPPF